MLNALSDFNDFLQSDAGNEVNHYSRILNCAEITTQNWREMRNRQQPIAEERDSLRSL